MRFGVQYQQDSRSKGKRGRVTRAFCATEQAEDA
jgi:hypothetical protein